MCRRFPWGSRCCAPKASLARGLLPTMGSSVLSEKGGSRRGHRTHVGAWQTCARMGGRRVECLKTYRVGGGGS